MRYGIRGACRHWVLRVVCVAVCLQLSACGVIVSTAASAAVAVVAIKALDHHHHHHDK